MRRLLELTGAAVLAAVFFSWGFLAHRDRAFPYRLIRSIAEDVELLVPDTGTLVKEVLPTTPQLKTLRSLPYLRSHPDQHGDHSGVVIPDPDLAEAGVNFYNSYGRSAAHLIDMDGRLLHEWVGDEGRVRRFACQYRGMDDVDKDVTARGIITGKRTEDGQNLVDLDVWTEDPDGKKTTPGTAVVSLPSRS